MHAELTQGLLQSGQKLYNEGLPAGFILGMSRDNKGNIAAWSPIVLIDHRIGIISQVIFALFSSMKNQNFIINQSFVHEFIFELCLMTIGSNLQPTIYGIDCTDVSLRRCSRYEPFVTTPHSPQHLPRLISTTRFRHQGDYYPLIYDVVNLYRRVH